MQWEDMEAERKSQITFIQLMEMYFRRASVLVKAVVQAKDHGKSGEVKDCLCDSGAIGGYCSPQETTVAP